MSPDRWQQIDQLFHAALEHASGERLAFLAHACDGDESLRREVESLIASHEESGNFFEAPAGDIAAAVLAETENRLTAGQSVGHYQIVSLLGEGGMGEVYLAHDVTMGRQVALKRLPAQFTLDADWVGRFRQEGRAVSAINHPNIVTIHEIGRSGSLHFIATEFIDGQTLRQQLGLKQLRLEEVLAIGAQVASALAAAHAAGIMHRDIKPENIMIRTDGYVKVLDFGLAKLVDKKSKAFPSFEESSSKQTQTAKGLILGTVSYMSPEQAKGEQVDERTDIFSLGTVIYEMIAGRTPFASESMPETFANLINAEPQPLSRFASNLPAELQRIVSKALQKNKNERYQTMKILLSDLKDMREKLTLDEKLERSYLHAADVTKPLYVTTHDADLQTSETTQSFSQGLKRHKPFAAFALVVLLLIGGISIALWRPRRKDIELSAPILSAPFASETLSTNGQVGAAIISPDGKNVVYLNGKRGKQSIWIKQLESLSNREIIPATGDVYHGLAFSPDGNFIYFVRIPKDSEVSAIYRVPLSGGISTQLIGGAGSWMNISPDGERFSFVRGDQLEDENCSLWIADAVDGKHEQQIASRRRPIRFGASAISPDGKSIAFAEGHSDNAGNEFALRQLNFASGVESEITAQKFFNIKHIVWLPNQSGLLLTASVNPNKNFRIWQVSTASGQASPLTNDSETYSVLSLNKDASVLVSTKVKADFRLQLFNTENPSRRLVLADARKATFAADGKVIFSSAMFGSNQDIWSARADGSEQRQLTNDPADDSTPAVSPDNNFIFFASNRTGQNQVWRMNTDGSNQTQLTQKEGGAPLFVSPNGKWVYYQNSLRANLWRASANGGDEQLVLDRRKNFFAISPDGEWAAFSETHGEERILTIVSLNHERPTKTFHLGDRKAYLLNMAWQPDGRNLAYILANREYGNNTVWRQSLAGGHPQQIASLGDEMIVSLAIAPDGKSFAIVQGVWRGDAVLIRGLR